MKKNDEKLEKKDNASDKIKIIKEIKKIDPKLSDENANQIFTMVTQSSSSRIQVLERHVGPLPPPHTLEKYDKILLGAAERILKMAEKQSNHRQTLEKKVVFTDSGNSRLGVWLAFFLATITIIGGGFLIYNDKDIAGLASIITAIGGLVGVFIYGRYQEKKELEKKEKDIQKNNQLFPE